MTFKYMLKAIAQQHGLHATFMPKPIEGIDGSGMHVHQSFRHIETGKNAFVDRGRSVRPLARSPSSSSPGSSTTRAASAA